MSGPLKAPAPSTEVKITPYPLTGLTVTQGGSPITPTDSGTYYSVNVEAQADFIVSCNEYLDRTYDYGGSSNSGEYYVGNLYAWTYSSTTVYTDTATPSTSSILYTSTGVATYTKSISIVNAASIELSDGNTYLRDTTSDINRSKGAQLTTVKITPYPLTSLLVTQNGQSLTVTPNSTDGYYTVDVAADVAFGVSCEEYIDKIYTYHSGDSGEYYLGYLYAWKIKANASVIPSTASTFYTASFPPTTTSKFYDENGVCYGDITDWVITDTGGDSASDTSIDSASSSVIRLGAYL